MACRLPQHRETETDTEMGMEMGNKARPYNDYDGGVSSEPCAAGAPPCMKIELSMIFRVYQAIFKGDLTVHTRDIS